MSTDVLHEFSRKRSKGKGIQGRIWWKKGRLYPRGAHAGDRREHRTLAGMLFRLATCLSMRLYA